VASTSGLVLVVVVMELLLLFTSSRGMAHDPPQPIDCVVGMTIVIPRDTITLRKSWASICETWNADGGALQTMIVVDVVWWA
jgi:hypothetical protein